MFECKYLFMRERNLINLAKYIFVKRLDNEGLHCCAIELLPDLFKNKLLLKLDNNDA